MRPERLLLEASAGSVVVQVSIVDGALGEPTAAQAVGTLQALHQAGELQQKLAAGGVTDVLDASQPPVYFVVPAETCDCDAADASDECKATCDTLGVAVGLTGLTLVLVIALPIVGCCLLALCVVLIVVCICRRRRPPTRPRLWRKRSPFCSDRPSPKHSPTRRTSTSMSRIPHDPGTE